MFFIIIFSFIFCVRVRVCVLCSGWCAFGWLRFVLRGCVVGFVCVGAEWINQIGCTNNNYASREKCKKCGQPKAIAAMPAIPGSSLPTYPNYFARDQKMNVGLMGNSPLQHSLHLPSPWSLGLALNSGIPYLNPINQLLVIPKGWRKGDWLCSCGFHNYSSRAQVGVYYATT